MSSWYVVVVAVCLGVGLATGAAPLRAEGQDATVRAREARDRGEHGAAVPLLEAALESARASLGQRHLQTLQLMYDLADSEAELGRYERAAALYAEVVAGRTALLGPLHEDTLMARHDLAFNLANQGRLREAAALHEEVLAARLQQFGEQHLHTQQSTNNLSLVYHGLGRVPQALALNERSLAYRRATYPADSPQVLVARNNRAALLRLLGRYREALAEYRELAGLYETAAGGRHPDRGAALNNLAVLHRDLGELAESLAVFERSLALQISQHGEGHPYLLETLGNVATARRELGRDEEALALYDRGIALARTVVGEAHPTTLLMMNNRATVLARLGRRDEQLALARHVLALRRDSLGERHPETLESMQTVGDALGALGRRPEQQSLLEQVVAVRTQEQGADHPDTLQAIGELAAAWRLGGRADEAARLQASALQALAAALGGAHPAVLRARENLARAEADAGRVTKAVAQSSAYVAGAERLRAQPGLAMGNRQALFQSYARAYRFFARSHLLAGQPGEALQLAELGKSRTLLEGLAGRHAGRFGALPADERVRLDELQRETAALEQLAARASDAEARRDLEARLNQRSRALESLQARLKQQHPKYAQLSDVRIVGADDLAGLLGANTVALDYVVDGDQVAVLLVLPGGRLQAVDLGRVPQLDSWVEVLRGALAWRGGLQDVLGARGQRAWRLTDGLLVMLEAAAAAPPQAVPVTQQDELAAYLSARLLAPLARWLQPHREWLVAPDGPLAQLPFEVLPWGAGQQPVVSSVQVQYTPSLSVHALSRDLARQHEGLAGRHALFAMADARYEGTSGMSGPSAWRNLPGSAAEARAVAALFPGSASLRLGDDATEAQLQALQLSGDLASFRYLLFSTHGFVSPSQPALSAIVLGQQDPAPGTDGQVTAAEWPGYDLRSDLVVLSGCDTGVGKVVAGEGVMGLPFALFVAGNVNTILTLWPVDDGASARFVEALFRRIAQGQRPAAALAATKREFAADRRYGHPRFWAPFVLIGPG